MVTHYFFEASDQCCQAFHGWRGQTRVRMCYQIFGLLLKNAPEFAGISIWGLFISEGISQIDGKIPKVFGLDL